MLSTHRHSYQGFTLVERLAVIAIIGVLVCLLFEKLTKQRDGWVAAFISSESTRLFTTITRPVISYRGIWEAHPAWFCAAPRSNHTNRSRSYRTR
ncbi:prepilin-type N-terminal cleavage/methylation domain-containing protein [Rhodopirellula sp. SWK7]|uniref:prepilin-type N-terminal cleavage/methylation domain-containing protein n=1 Tax=Rhodopirellula sp. SWK7 TaxID=595460 RepID=UPI0005C6B236|nr:prepilin-type N-terminal cleavage/methylation domain-containing protein [Rhodopirellula sp. SWK7]